MDGKTKTTSPEFQSRVCNIKIYFTSKALDRKNKFNYQGANNNLSRHLSENDIMLEYHQTEIQFSTYKFFSTEKGHQHTELFLPSNF